MLGLDQLVTVAIAYLSKSKAVEKASDVAEKAIRGKVAQVYGRLKQKLIDSRDGSADVAATIERLESEPESVTYREQLKQELSEVAAPEQDPELADLKTQLEALLRQTPVAEQLSINVQTSGDKNIVIGKGNMNAGDINFGG